MRMPPKSEIPRRTRQASDLDPTYKPSRQQNTNTWDNYFLRSTAEVITVAILFEETVEFFTPTMSHTSTSEEDTISAMSNPPDLETIAPQQGEPSMASVLSMVSEMLKQSKAERKEERERVVKWCQEDAARRLSWEKNGKLRRS